MGHAPRAASRAEPGARVAHYEIVDELGRGGMGVVYRARDLTLGRQVALKRPLPADDDDPLHRRRLLREARAAARLSHPHIVPIYEVLEHDGVPWLAMELVEGTTLRGLLAEGRPLPLTEVVRYAEGLASALETAHAHHVLHRDINPNNVMITKGRAVLTDFGLARILAASEDSTTHSRDSGLDSPGRVVGTLRYMSPEQSLGKPLDARSDLFSMGAVIYEMCTGQPAFPGEGPEVLDAVLHRPPTPVSRLNYEVPEELERIVRKCLTKDPDDRYQSARDLGVDLRALRRRLEHEEYPEEPVRGGGPRGAWPPRRWAGAALVIVALAAAGVAWWVWNRTRPAPPPPAAAVAHTLAFVPLELGNADPGWEHLVQGVTDDLVRELQRSGVAVKGRESAAQLATLTNAAIARRLGVDRIGRGRVSVTGGDIVLELRVIQAANDAEIWRRTYRQPLDRLGGVYVAVAADIAAVTLDRPVRAPETEALARKADAYKAYYRGRFYWGQRTKEGLRMSIGYFQLATGLDATYAQAWSGQADAYLGLGVPTFGALHPQEARARGKEAAVKGVTVGPQVAEVQASLAYATYAYDWEWRKAGTLFRNAIGLNPQYATAHHWYADYLNAVGRPEEAMREIQTALALEPGSLAIQRDVAWPWFFQKRYDLAIASLTKMLEASPGFTAARSLLGRALIEAGRPAEGLEEMKRIEHDLPVPAAQSFIAYAEAANANRPRAEAALREGLRPPDNLPPGEEAPYASPYLVALAYTRLGRPADALRWLEKGYEDHDPLMTTLMVDPRLDPLRGEPGFQALMRKMDFPEAESR
jgi:TolB-like protein/tetratricopeptide (TPR) repeat protein